MEIFPINQQSRISMFLGCFFFVFFLFCKLVKPCFGNSSIKILISQFSLHKLINSRPSPIYIYCPLQHNISSLFSQHFVIFGSGQIYLKSRACVSLNPITRSPESKYGDLCVCRPRLVL